MRRPFKERKLLPRLTKDEVVIGLSTLAIGLGLLDFGARILDNHRIGELAKSTDTGFAQVQENTDQKIKWSTAAAVRAQKNADRLVNYLTNEAVQGPKIVSVLDGAIYKKDAAGKTVQVVNAPILLENYDQFSPDNVTDGMWYGVQESSNVDISIMAEQFDAATMEFKPFTAKESNIQRQALTEAVYDKTQRAQFLLFIDIKGNPLIQQDGSPVLGPGMEVQTPNGTDPGRQTPGNPISV